MSPDSSPSVCHQDPCKPKITLDRRIEDNNNRRICTAGLEKGTKTLLILTDEPARINNTHLRLHSSPEKRFRKSRAADSRVNSPVTPLPRGSAPLVSPLYTNPRPTNGHTAQVPLTPTGTSMTSIPTSRWARTPIRFDLLPGCASNGGTCGREP
jgi:hypothetical protein